MSSIQNNAAQNAASTSKAAEQVIIRKMMGAEVTFGPGLEVKDVAIPSANPQNRPLGFKKNQYTSVTYANVVRLHWRNLSKSAILTYRDSKDCHAAVRHFANGTAEVCGKVVRADFLASKNGPQLLLCRVPLEAVASDIVRDLPLSIRPIGTFLRSPRDKLEPVSQLAAISRLLSDFGPLLNEVKIEKKTDISEARATFINEADARQTVENLHNTVQRSAGVAQLFAEIVFTVEFSFSAQWLRSMKQAGRFDGTNGLQDGINGICYKAFGETGRLVIQSTDGEDLLSSRKLIESYLQPFVDACEYDEEPLGFQYAWRRGSVGATCAICYDVPKFPIKTSCGHVYCDECYAHTVESNAKLTSENGIKCFGDEGKCNQLLSLKELDLNLGYRVMDELIEASLSSYLRANTSKYHNCPTPGCEQVYKPTPMIEDNKGVIARCMGCLELLCTSCHVQHEHKVPCDKAEDVANSALLATLNIKKCPSCKTPIDRFDGCNHVACTCGRHVCWVCMEHYEDAMACYNHMLEAHGGAFAGIEGVDEFGGRLDEI
ncbi:hypothetical protein CORC01_08660 [Colletotrichum orchidophilum]|uniref:RBR-type E3 ubiquitin transferase n=1 Tax=Colletotrichum orchidophilum TaxID=1209926 RepID=A0A1G4B3J5_9PEZI|nr:uncharacterized protein CORC01_08660 [Colletotrichum orchidophilum]OHE95967.1 hypothetical protein CORC01_08660 [Colletotrichum orchidophilum]